MILAKKASGQYNQAILFRQKKMPLSKAPKLSTNKSSKNKVRSKLNAWPQMQSLNIQKEVQDLQSLESYIKTAESSEQKNILRKEVLESSKGIDTSDGVDSQEQMILDLIENILWDLFGVVDIDLDDDELKDLLRSHGSTKWAITSLLFSLRDRQKKSQKIFWSLSAVWSNALSNLNNQKLQALLKKELGSSLYTTVMNAETIDELMQSMAMMKCKQLDEALSEEQQQEIQKKMEKIIADLFERKQLEIYEIQIDQGGNIIIKAKDPQSGKDITLVYEMATDSLTQADESGYELSSQTGDHLSDEQKKTIMKERTRKRKKKDPRRASYDDDLGMLQFMLTEWEKKKL